MAGQNKTDRRFGKSARLTGRSNFLEVFRGESKKYFGSGVTLLAAQADSEPTRFGISISKKCGNAVRRNRIKRIIREFLRNNKNIWPANKKIVISIKEKIDDENILCAEIERLLRKINE